MRILKELLLLCSGALVLCSPSEPPEGDALDSAIQSFGGTAKLSSNHDLFDKARSLLASFQKSPSCVRLAAVSLLNSCEDVEPRPLSQSNEISTRLERVKSTFAARIAICELMDASANVPQACSSLVPSTQDATLRRFGSMFGRQPSELPKTQQSSLIVDDSQLSACLRSLESRPQWWTSYSNGRQNAVIMCQAVRSEADKEELLELHKWTMDVTSDLHSALADSLEDSQKQAEQQQEYLEYLRELQGTLMREFSRVEDYSQRLMSKTSASMDKLLQDLLLKATQSGDIIDSQSMKARQSFEDSSQRFELLERSRSKIFQDLVQGAAELASHHQADWEKTHQSALALHEIMHNTQEDFVAQFLPSYNLMQKEIVAAGQAALQLHQHQAQLDTRMAELNRAFSNIEQRADIFQSAQETQQQDQIRLLEALRIDLTSAQSALVEMATSAQTLHSTVVDTSAKIESFGKNPFYWSVWNSVSSYIILAVCIAMLSKLNFTWLFPAVVLLIWLGSQDTSLSSALLFLPSVVSFLTHYWSQIAILAAAFAIAISITSVLLFWILPGPKRGRNSHKHENLHKDV